ncbi:MAG: type II secretion system secretin GspD [Gammaproteobacteria bacterium]|nr:type II secretion system secretin GspD [Gammaproteobacteria bacterium]
MLRKNLSASFPRGKFSVFASFLRGAAVLCCLLLSACSMLSEKKQPPARSAAKHPPAPPAGKALDGEGSSLLPQGPAAALLEIDHRGGLPGIGKSTAASPPVPKVSPADDIIALDYEQVELRQILEELADVLGMSVVIDSSIGDKVTMRTAADKPLKHADLWPLMQLLLSDAKINIEKKGKVYHLKKMTGALPAEIGGLSSVLTDSNAPQVLQITPLRYVSLEAVQEAVKPLIMPDGRLIKLPTLNLIGIVTSPDRLRRVNQLLTLIDADPFVHRGMRLFRLNDSKVSEVQEELDKILKAVEGSKPAYQIIGLERINALLIVAPPNRGFAQVKRWVDILDEEEEEGMEQVFIYRVRNLKAATLASTLSEVFSVDDKKRVKRNTPKSAKKTAQGKKKTPARVVPKRSSLTVSAELQVNIVADEDTNSLLVRANPKDYRQLLETIRILDRVPKEVMINVLVAEIELNKGTEFGIDWTAVLGDRGGFVRTNFGIGSSPSTGTDDTAVTTDSFLGFSAKQAGGRLTSALKLVATDNNAEVLSRPSILVRNNQEAKINVGSDVPTITQINNNTSSGSIITTSNQVQYRKTGIILTVTPHINEDGIVNMEISQEISSIGAPGIVGSPSFKERKVETSVVVRDGTVIVLGGLIKTDTNDTFRGVPGLMNIPMLGSLFSTKTKSTVRSELVVMIMPQIVHPEVDNSEYVLWFNGRMKAVSALLNGLDIPLFRNAIPASPEPPPAPAPVPASADEDEDSD